MKFGQGDLYNITASSNQNSINLDNLNSINTSYKVSEIEIKNSKDVDKKNLIELDKNTIFEFNSEVKGDYLTITLSEVDALAPFVYTVDLTLKDIIEVDIMFKSCDSLKIVKEHIDRLFQDGKVKIKQTEDDEITLLFQGLYISYVREFKIVTERKMTENKDNMLMKLYSLDKKKKKILDDLQAYLKRNDEIDIDEIKKIINEEKD